MAIKIKRIYEEKSSQDGYRVLVDRVWPRGISKEKAGLDQWFKEVAPSKELRKWFNHEDVRYEEFAKKYRQELEEDTRKKELDQLKELAKKGDLTLVYSAKNIRHNQARVLKELLSGDE